MDVTCQICCDSYATTGLRRPRILPCGHTLCGICATKLLVNWEIKCPMCQQTYTFQDLDEITINRELENVFERLTLEPTSPTAPKLHDGICEEHGAYKVHYCLTHEIFICSDCVVAYHLEGDCRRAPISKIFDNRKSYFCNVIGCHISSLQETGRQIQLFNNVLKDTEPLIKTQMNDTELQIKNQITYKEIQILKLQSDLKALEQQMSNCQENASNYAAVIKDCASQYTTLYNDCENCYQKAEDYKSNTQSITTFQELNDVTQWIASSPHKRQEWNKNIKVGLNQCFGKLLHSGTLAKLLTYQEIYATQTVDGDQLWGCILARNGYLLLQDLRSDMPPPGAIVIDLVDVTYHLSSPRHVYLSIGTQGKRGRHLGSIIISVNEEAPRHAQLLVNLCMNQMGTRDSATKAIDVADKGEPYERLLFNLLGTNNETSDEQVSEYLEVMQDLEESEEIAHKQGLVISSIAEYKDIGIFTRSGFELTCEGPAIGEVVSGFPVLEKIIGDNLVAEGDLEKSQLTIVESGLVLDSSFQK